MSPKRKRTSNWNRLVITRTVIVQTSTKMKCESSVRKLSRTSRKFEDYQPKTTICTSNCWTIQPCSAFLKRLRKLSETIPRSWLSCRKLSIARGRMLNKCDVSTTRSVLVISKKFECWRCSSKMNGKGSTNWKNDWRQLRRRSPAQCQKLVRHKTSIH